MELSAFGNRLAKLRMDKGISAREMSLTLGMSENYINKIENKKAFPSMKAFFDICALLEITPKEFFDEDNDNPKMLNSVVISLERLSEKALTSLGGFLEEFSRPYNDKA